MDYADAANWHKMPDITRDADTFYIYPTLYSGDGKDAPPYAAIDEPEMTGELKTVSLMQAGAFEGITNVFIPYYRQASLKTQLEAHLKTGSIDAVLSALPVKDLIAALDHYFENLNGGRPFILAAHSQGAAIARLLLKTYFKDHPGYYRRMAAAYVLGYSVTHQDLEENPHLKFATGETDTGVIVSWNTEGRKNVDSDADNIVVLKGSIAINPLNWKRDGTYAPASMNLGSLVLNKETGGTEIADIGADAQVNAARGVVVTNAHASPVTHLAVYFGPESFHMGDFSFYYMNIRDNAAKRIAAFLAEEWRQISGKGHE